MFEATFLFVAVILVGTVISIAVATGSNPFRKSHVADSVVSVMTVDYLNNIELDPGYIGSNSTYHEWIT